MYSIWSCSDASYFTQLNGNLFPETRLEFGQVFFGTGFSIYDWAWVIDAYHTLATCLDWVGSKMWFINILGGEIL